MALELRKVSIREILIHESLGICVVPVLPPSFDYQFVYRAARSARWNVASQMFYLLPIPGWSHLDSFRSIVGSVAAEYGELLVGDQSTIWTDVPAFVRSEIETYSL